MFGRGRGEGEGGKAQEPSGRGCTAGAGARTAAGHCRGRVRGRGRGRGWVKGRGRAGAGAGREKGGRRGSQMPTASLEGADPGLVFAGRTDAFGGAGNTHPLWRARNGVSGIGGGTRTHDGRTARSAHRLCTHRRRPFLD